MQRLIILDSTNTADRVTSSRGGLIPCPICFSTEQQVVLTYGSKSLRKCSTCGVRFVFPQPTPESLDAHFENGGTPGFDNLASSFESNRDRVLLQVAGYIQSRTDGAELLDVGCATGYFLWKFFAGPNWRKSAIELSHRAASIAADRGIEVFAGTLSQANFESDRFDIVTVLDAFYYFAEPHFELAEIRRVLRKDGLLFLELPLSWGRIWRTTGLVGKLLSGNRRPLLETSDHLFYYDRKSISFLLENCGFMVEEIVPLPANRQPGWQLDLAYRLFSLFATTCSRLSGSRVFRSPRFLVVAAKHRADS